MRTFQEPGSYRVRHAIQTGLISSLYLILVMVVLFNDYEQMTFLRWFSCGIFGAIFCWAFIANQTHARAWKSIGLGLLALVLVWLGAFVLAPL